MPSHRLAGTALQITILALFSTPAVALSQQQVSSEDGSIAVVIPEGFSEVQINAAADLQYADTVAGSFFMVLTEPKEDLFGWNLTRHSMITLAQILAVTDFPELTGPTTLALGGHPAVQYELQGVSQGTQITILHTTVDAPTEFAQVLAWSQRSRWGSNEPVLRNVLASIEFAETDGSAAMPATDVYTILPGTWAWEGSETGCSSDTQTYSISADRQSMTITHSEPYERSDGVMTSTTSYVIEGSTPLVLHTYIEDESRLTEDGVPVKWDLVVIGRDRFAWHRTDWAEGALTKAMVRCARPGA